MMKNKCSTLYRMRESVESLGWDMSEDVYKQVIMYFNSSPPYDNYSIIKAQLNISDWWRE